MSEVYINKILFWRKLSIVFALLGNILLLFLLFFGNPHNALSDFVIALLFTLISVPLASLFLLLSFFVRGDDKVKELKDLTVISFWSSILFSLLVIPIFGVFYGIFFVFWLISFFMAFKGDKEGSVKLLYRLSFALVFFTLIVFIFLLYFFPSLYSFEIFEFITLILF
jgi:hypothetical protein